METFTDVSVLCPCGLKALLQQRKIPDSLESLLRRFLSFQNSNENHYLTDSTTRLVQRHVLLELYRLEMWIFFHHSECVFQEDQSYA